MGGVDSSVQCSVFSIQCLPGAWGMVAACLVMVAGMVGAQEVVPKPAWEVEEAESRLVVRRGVNDYFLVEITAAEGQSAARAFSGKAELPARVVRQEGNRLTVMVAALEGTPKQVIRVYPAATAGVGSEGVVDPKPLYGVAQRTAGMDLPRNLDEVRILETRFDGKPSYFSVASFGDLGETFKGWYRGDWTRKSHLVRLSSWLEVPAAGKFIFGLAGVSPIWLLVDGELIMEHPANQPHDKWSAGGEVEIREGLRRVELLTVVRDKIDTGIAWKRVGEEGIATDVKMITGGELLDGRLERKGVAIHPYGRATSGAAYQFRGVDEVFEPVRFANASTCWSGEHVAEWGVLSGRAGDEAGSRSDGLVVIPRSRLPMTAELKVTAEGGESDFYRLEVKAGQAVWAEYALSARVTSLPAVCYGEDKVRPIIRVRSTAPDELRYDLKVTLSGRDGKREEREIVVVTSQGVANSYLDEFSASSMERIEWQLSHAGVVLDSGRALFLREPFDKLPDTVSGESFKSGSEFVVLVAKRAIRGSDSDRRGGVVEGSVGLLDGFIYSAGVGSGSSEWQVATVANGEYSGSAELQPFVTLRELLPAATLIYAPPLDTLLHGSGEEGFERRLSAMTGLLAGSACGGARVLLVVPPTFDVLPGCGCEPGETPCRHAARAREYAALVVRVADAHGVETIDLFTAFHTSGTDIKLVERGILTPAGVALAEELIRRKLGSL